MQAREEFSQQMVEAWKIAQRELKIDVQTPFLLDGTAYPVLVVGFGSPKGTVPVLIGENANVTPLQQAGYYTSQLNPDRYSRFSRELFIDTLNDWGWFGTNAPPTWYTGV